MEKSEMNQSSRQFFDNLSINQSVSLVNSQTNLSTRSSLLMDITELISNTRDYEMFRRFLESHNSINDLDCWMDIEAFS
jgi:hypothetical protein